MDALSTNTTSHVKILAFQFISLTKQPSSPPLISRAEFVGIIVAVNRRPHFLNFLIDDGTGCIPCILWRNHLDSPYFSRHSHSDVRLLIDTAARHASTVRLGALARVRGRITAYRVLQKVSEFLFEGVRKLHKKMGRLVAAMVSINLIRNISEFLFDGSIYKF